MMYQYRLSLKTKNLDTYRAILAELAKVVGVITTNYLYTNASTADGATIGSEYFIDTELLTKNKLSDLYDVTVLSASDLSELNIFEIQNNHSRSGNKPCTIIKYQSK